MLYETRDSQYAAILFSQGQRFTSKTKLGTVWFQFEDSARCNSIIDAHLNKELVVYSIELTNAMHEIKKIIIRNKN